MKEIILQETPADFETIDMQPTTFTPSFYYTKFIRELYIPNTTGCSGTQSQSSLIQSNSDACKLQPIKPGRNILTEKVKKKIKNIMRLI